MSGQERGLNLLHARLRESGQRLAPRRLLILETLDAHGDHATADALFAGAHERHRLVWLKRGDVQEIGGQRFKGPRGGLREACGFESRIDHLAIFGTCLSCATDGSAPNGVGAV